MSREQKEIRDKLLACRHALVGLAAKDEDARRRYPERDDDNWLHDFGSPYALDIDKIYNSKAIRRLGKTQVVISPKNAHARNRMVHSLEVASNARLIARILGLNETLCEAGGLAHDFGHTPFGHYGEEFLNKEIGTGFRHEVFGVIIAQKIERKTAGLNLTRQTLDVIRWHSRGKGKLMPSGVSAEADVVMNSDKISYIFADYSDIFGRQAYGEATPRLKDFPGLAEEMSWFGRGHRNQIQAAITGLCLESAAEGRISFTKGEAAQRFARVKALMYQVYGQLYPRNNFGLLRLIYDCLAEAVPEVDPSVLFALMGDQDILWLSEQVCRGQRLQPKALAELAVNDSIPYLRNVTFDLTDPDLDW